MRSSMLCSWGSGGFLPLPNHLIATFLSSLRTGTCQRLGTPVTPEVDTAACRVRPHYSQEWVSQEWPACVAPAQEEEKAPAGGPEGAGRGIFCRGMEVAL